MSLNVERARRLFRGLREEDPHADARRQLIAPDAPDAAVDAVRAQAVALLSTELLRDPFDLVSGEAPRWLVELSRQFQPGPTLLFDARLNDLSTRAVEDLVSQGVDPQRLVDWLEARRRAPKSFRSSSREGDSARPR